MYPAERQLAILAEARSGDGRVSVARLSARLGVTSTTIRRDLDDLERDGVLRRQHGGAQLVRTVPFEPALLVRRATDAAERGRIAQAVVQLLPDDGVVLLDSGALMLSVAEIFPTDRDLVVVTNNLPAAVVLAAHPCLTVIALPGRVRSLTQATVDERARARLEGLNVDLALLGANGLTSAGATTTIPAEAAIKHQMITTARRSVLAVTAPKVGVTSFCRFADVEEFEQIITDDRITENERDDLEGAGIELMVVTG
ncbi:Transcriptional repressor of the fructose operon, DeoR family [Microbacterium esteraromaticum]|uniref:Lactose phosphotransferase system repressor n=1 Tax=Microbacterium esteraromaticum TaxID=57043 RepID=A0A1R4K6N7_9MICO|nr:DeoR/GlpR family DNA-binding transcription regulator [Microbacterium esteraromaticum]SJN39977.1 Transcriptional repressor of the fructose operon, DeoR family [Microbacterium esteraromaticum]